jgi:hypothetical protein
VWLKLWRRWSRAEKVKKQQVFFPLYFRVCGAGVVAKPRGREEKEGVCDLSGVRKGKVCVCVCSGKKQKRWRRHGRMGHGPDQKDGRSPSTTTSSSSTPPSFLHADKRRKMLLCILVLQPLEWAEVVARHRTPPPTRPKTMRIKLQRVTLHRRRDVPAS